MKASESTIKQVFLDEKRTFKIPRYQRPYSWKEDEILQLWEDIWSEDPSFIGTLILSFENKDATPKEVIDGQQRFISITILYSAIRNYLKILATKEADAALAKEMTEAAGDYNNNIGRPKRGRDGKRDFIYLLEVGDTTYDFFREFIQKDSVAIESLTPSKNEEHERIRKNYLKFKELISFEIEKKKSSEIIEYFGQLHNRIEDLQVVAIQVEDENKAYEIFESVNAKGVELGVADLIKNQIFSKVKLTGRKKQDIATEAWTSIQKNIDDSGSSIKEFIQYHWTSKYGYVPDKKLYSSIKNRFRNDSSMWGAFLTELEASSEIYKILLIGSKEDLVDFAEKPSEVPKLYYSLRALRVMSNKTWLVLFLAIFRNWESIPINLENKWKIFERFVFLYFDVLGLPGNWFFRLMHSKANELENLCSKRSSKADAFNKFFTDLYKEFHSKRPSFDNFSEGFYEIQYKDKPKERSRIRYILDQIETKLNSKFSEGYNEDKVNIEHIIPQKPAKWKLAPKDIRPFVHRLGNLILINKVNNSVMQEDTIVKKVNNLSKSELKQVKEFVDNYNSANWDFNNITPSNFEPLLKRQKALAEIGFKIWVEDNFKSMGLT